MYMEFYKLNGRPFQLTPDPRFYFDTRTHKKAMAYLTYGINQGEGFIIITGDIGAGKTTLVGHLFDALDKTRFLLAKIVSTQLDADNTLKMVANAFGIGTDGLEKSAILHRIEDFLRSQHREGRRVLLIVDEVQNLPVSALEELRMLSNFQEGNRALLQIFLLGQPEFRDKLALSPELEQLRQRVIATHHLEPMQEEEVPGYVYHRLKLCGWQNDPMFTPEAFSLMFEYSGGVPRRLNNLCSRVLLFGALEELHEIDEKVVREVIDDLKKDQTPTTGPKHISQVDTVSGVGPMRSNIPPKVRAELAAAASEVYLNGAEAHILRRLEVLERYVRQHDRTIRQMLDILSEWAENASDSYSKTGTDAQ
ncbi:XrtA/PEP-CTERM system-associated ATPase [Pedomonas mirosovicensis]|uniref:XrtA/PEP-CTERM system-associated ATPase n=1 Tax=Pedomonas mirosovicensis TaxID=2908641 RepID=UPI002167F001|nr:XrtA/PEP-CTERM system-associated ATPase [Pedomonas mirosovicensis]MCH8684319.1 XrtA-associated ATPase [Pedomonas mirosovicensis]